MALPNLDALGFDNALKAVAGFFLSPVPPPPPEPVPPETTRELWQQTSDILNRGAPDRPVQRGVVLREADGRTLTADIYPPDGPGPHPVVLFLHGGAWVAGSPATHHKLTCRFAEAGYLTISVDYALAPEHRYPAGLEDCVFAAGWAIQHAAELGGDPARMAISGDSAGGNLAAAVIATLLAATGTTPFQAAALIYGVYDWPLLDRIPVGSPFHDWRAAQRGAANYLGDDGARKREPGVSPACSPHLAGFPPSLLLVGTNDPLLTQSITFTADLQRAGVDAELRVYDDMPHAFLQIEEFPACLEAQQAIWSFLAARLATGAGRRPA